MLSAGNYHGRRMPFVHNLGWGIADDLIEMLELGYQAQQVKIAAGQAQRGKPSRLTPDAGFLVGGIPRPRRQS